MSPEAAEREAREKEQMEAAQALADREAARVSSGTRRRSGHSSRSRVQPVPASPQEGQSFEAQDVVARAEAEAKRTQLHGANEEEVPDRTRAATSPSEKRSTMQSNHLEPILPVVEEAAEASSQGTADRPRTPAKNDPALLPSQLPELGPRTPPKTGHLKPDSADSGYGNGGRHSLEASPRIRHRISKESLNKELPPLPSDEPAAKTTFA